MKRTLVAIRHAKASNPKWGEEDYDRRLNETGETEAETMGEKLAKLDIKPSIIVCSPAKRTKQTAKRIAKKLNYSEDDIIYIKNLYHCEVQQINDAIISVSNEVGCMFIVAHNPAITTFVNQLAPHFEIDNMPTCGAVIATAESDTWQQFLQYSPKDIIFQQPGK
ncbi:MAG: hypothetical protein EBX41_02270 [Chitinophagia bacterium]|nr:hypothetical protein [Chitinophagia bacterium]